MNSDSFQQNQYCLFRPLENELHLEEVAGYHSGSESVIYQKCIGNHLVVDHEAKHDNLIRETPFGGIILAFRKLYKSTNEKKIKENSVQWLHKLIDVSRTTQECYATYLSIKEFPCDKHNQLISILTPQYKERYFEYLAHLIDPVFHCSYLQFLLGKVLIEACMASRLIEYLCDWSLDLPIQIPNDQAPDYRLTKIHSEVKKILHELLGIIETSVTNDNIKLALPSNFNVQREEAWLSLPQEISNNLDSYLIRIVRNWLHQIVKTIPLPYFPPDKKWLYLFDRLINTFKPFIDKSSFESITIPPERWSYESVIWQRAQPHGLTTIYNEIANPAKFNLVDFKNPIDVFISNPSGPRTFITDSISNGKSAGLFWNCFTKGGDQVYRTYKLSHKLLLKALLARKQIASLGLPIPTIDCFVVGLRWDSTLPFESLYRELLDHLMIKFQDGVMNLGYNRIVWYMGEDFFGWYETLILHGDLECMTIHGAEQHNRNVKNIKALFKKYDINQDTPISEIVKKVRLSDTINLSRIKDETPEWLVLRSPSIAGLFLRILPSGTLIGMGPIISHDIEKGYLKTIPNEKRSDIANIILKAEMPIALSWQKY